MEELQELGEFRNNLGRSQGVIGVVSMNPDGTLIQRNELGLTPFEAKVIRTLCEIRDRLPAPAAKPVAAAPKA